uniref:Uncharacterized LOC100175081 n=2 Tax=Ciona intestinalis TaxID=7719 RepID=A0A3Q0PR93_CIOIN|nr:uncharacterized protein LOC100175081 isoform X1 [Ciona intestinalis]|eukprot:XP_009858638.1 uncharacterized protein LOC100175081 isoform X1 [Ciona intestinalis]
MQLTANISALLALFLICQLVTSASGYFISSSSDCTESVINGKKHSECIYSGTGDKAGNTCTTKCVDGKCTSSCAKLSEGADCLSSLTDSQILSMKLKDIIEVCSVGNAETDS